MRVRTLIRRWVPLSPSAWRRIAVEIQHVLISPWGLVLATAIAFMALTIFVLPSNLRLVLDVIVTGDADISTRIAVLFALYPFVGGALNPFSETLLVLLAGLTGVTVSIILSRFIKGGADGGLGTTSTGVLLMTATGGCAACGTTILAAASGVGAAGALAILPWKGTELQVLAGLLLVISLHRLAMLQGSQSSCDL